MASVSLNHLMRSLLHFISFMVWCHRTTNLRSKCNRINDWTDTSTEVVPFPPKCLVRVHLYTIFNEQILWLQGKLILIETCFTVALSPEKWQIIYYYSRNVMNALIASILQSLGVFLLTADRSAFPIKWFEYNWTQLKSGADKMLSNSILLCLFCFIVTFGLIRHSGVDGFPA